MKKKRWIVEVEWEPEPYGRDDEPIMPLEEIIRAFGKQLGSKVFKRIEVKEVKE